MNQPDPGETVTDAVSLVHVVRVAWRGRWLVLAATFVAAGAALVAALLMTPQYRAQVVVMPVTSDLASGSGVEGLVRGLGGLASLAGLGIGGGTNRDEVLEYLRSRTFTTEFIQENDLLPILFERDWDASAGRWRVPADEIPTLGDAYELFTEDVRTILDDRKTGIVRVSITWSDRQLAAEWANKLVARANERLRERAIGESERSIEYLRREASRTTFVAVEEAIGRLTEEQVKSIMLANVRQEFALKVIDPAVVPEVDEVVRPRRALMTAIGAVFGFSIGLLAVLARERLARAR